MNRQKQAQKRYRERYKESTGKDPFICPHCGQEMDICTIWHPRYGVIYDELDEIRRGKYEQKEKEAFGEEGNGRAVRVLRRRSTITVVQYVELSFWSTRQSLMQESGWPNLTRNIMEANRFGRSCEVSRTTISNYLSVLEATFVVHVIRPYSTHRPKDLIMALKTCPEYLQVILY